MYDPKSVQTLKHYIQKVLELVSAEAIVPSIIFSSQLLLLLLLVSSPIKYFKRIHPVNNRTKYFQCALFWIFMKVSVTKRWWVLTMFVVPGPPLGSDYVCQQKLLRTNNIKFHKDSLDGTLKTWLTDCSSNFDSPNIEDGQSVWNQRTTPE